jgi:2-oxoglutarate dehydrogenase E1 component
MDELIRVAGGRACRKSSSAWPTAAASTCWSTRSASAVDAVLGVRGQGASDLSAGDVKYHMGFSSDVMTPGGPVHLTLAFNPSHLEIVNPVVAGSVYARQPAVAKTARSRCCRC